MSAEDLDCSHFVDRYKASVHSRLDINVYEGMFMNNDLPFYTIVYHLQIVTKFIHEKTQYPKRVKRVSIVLSKNVIPAQ